MGLVSHSSSDDSVPLHTTLSSRMGPEPLPKKAPWSGTGSTNIGIMLRNEAIGPAGTSCIVERLTTPDIIASNELAESKI